MASVVGKTIFSDGKGKLFFGYYKDNDAVEFVDYKTWKKLSFKDVSKGDTNKERVIKAIVKNQKQFNKKVDFNMWAKKQKRSFDDTMDWFIKNGWISNITKRGIKESVDIISVNEDRNSNMFYVLYQKKGVFGKPVAAGYKDRKDAEKFAKSLGNNHNTMILDKQSMKNVKGVDVNESQIAKKDAEHMERNLRGKGERDVKSFVDRVYKFHSKDIRKYMVDAFLDYQKGKISKKEFVSVLGDLHESVNESAGKEAMGIAALTGTRGSAVQDFIDKNRINSKKLFRALKSANLQGRMNFASALSGKPGNPNEKLTIKLFGESVNEGKKRFRQQNGIGKSKYTISYHDGKKKHKDGSDFFDIQIFRNKKDLETFKKDLVSKGFVKESVNEDTKKRFDVDFYKGDGDRQTSHEEIIRGDKFSDVVSQATKVAKSKGMNHVEFYYKDAFIGSIDKRNGYEFKKGRSYQKSPLSVNEAKFGYKDSTASYINNHKDEYKQAEKMNKGNEVKFYDLLQKMEDKIGHPKFMIFLSNALRGYKVDMYKDPKIKNPQDAQEALFLLSK